MGLDGRWHQGLSYKADSRDLVMTTAMHTASYDHAKVLAWSLACGPAAIFGVLRAACTPKVRSACPVAPRHCLMQRTRLAGGL